LTTHARYNEITAIRAAGVSLWRLCLPYFAVGLVASVGLFALDEFCVPRTAAIAEEIMTRRVQRHLTAAERQQVKNLDFVNAREGRFWHVGVYNQKTGEMIKPLVDWRLKDGSRLIILADRAIRTNGVWSFYNARQSRQPASTNALSVRLPPVNVLAMPEFTETREEIRSEISVSESYSHPTRTHRADLPISEIWNYLRLHPNPEPPALRAWLYTKLQGRFAGPFTCLVVVLIAVPFAAGSGRRNVFVGVAASILIFFIYFILQQLGFAFGEAGRLPAWFAAWLPNLLFGIAGLWMMRRVR
jgi:lipopolysaccharide export system permease protein